MDVAKHLPRSPNFTPYNLHFSGHLKQHLSGRHFNTQYGCSINTKSVTSYQDWAPTFTAMTWILSLQDGTHTSTGQAVTLPSAPHHTSSHMNYLILWTAFLMQLFWLFYTHTLFLHYKINRKIRQCASKTEQATLNSNYKISYIM